MNIRRYRKRGEVNIVPLVDVLTSLIFFFLITMQFKDIYAVDITPPNMESSTESAKNKPDTIGVSKDGRYFFNAKEISLEDLKKHLAEISEDENRSLILFADKETQLQYATSVIDLVKLAKIKRLSLQTEK